MRRRTGNKGAVILDAAMSCFMRQGIAATTMQQIAERAGLAVGTVYLYYANKEEVVGACADLFATRHLEESRELVESSAGEPASAIRAYLTRRYDAWKQVSDGSPQAAELAAAVILLRPERMADFEQLFVRTLERLIAMGIERGSFRRQDPARAARVLAHSVAIFFPFPGREHPRLPGREAFEETVAWLIESGLASEERPD